GPVFLVVAEIVERKFPLARVEGGGEAVVVGDVEHGGDVGLVVAVQVLAELRIAVGDPIVALFSDDAPAGHHAGVIGEGDGVNLVGAGVGGVGALPSEPVEGRQGLRSEGV